MSGGNVVGVILSDAFSCKKVEVAAPGGVWIRPADRGSRVIDGAAALLGVEKSADPSEVGVFLAAHRVLAAVSLGRERFSGLFKRHVEMATQSLNVTLVECNEGIGAAVTGAFQAVVHVGSVLRFGRMEKSSALSVSGTSEIPLSI